METEVKKAIEEYQCSGCIVGGDTTCFGKYDAGVGCGKHMSGTIISYIGNILLGMPKGFNRLGATPKLKPRIYKTFSESESEYGKWNVPVWKYLNESGHTLVRGLSPRNNSPFIDIYLENCLDKIDCLEITKADVDYMD